MTSETSSSRSFDSKAIPPVVPKEPFGPRYLVRKGGFYRSDQPVPVTGIRPQAKDDFSRPMTLYRIARRVVLLALGRAPR
jgi:hypothetical protein